jgi:CRISPR-associated protein Cas6
MTGGLEAPAASVAAAGPFAAAASAVAPAGAADALDVVFPLSGRTLARDHRLALVSALCAILPDLAHQPGLAVLPVPLVQGSGTKAGDCDLAWLSARAQLTVRLPRERAGMLQALEGRVLQVGDSAVRLGVAHARELLAHSTLIAHFVACEDSGAAAAAAPDEASFLDAVQRELDALAVRAHAVCGKHQFITTAEGPLGGCSLMLHGLSAAASRRILARGLGVQRLLGCGVFLPHKSAAAVGD